ncbi:hypothetical protein MD484_g1093, partial [Candolleomyces efflorescens]
MFSGLCRRRSALASFFALASALPLARAIVPYPTQSFFFDWKVNEQTFPAIPFPVPVTGLGGPLPPGIKFVCTTAMGTLEAVKTPTPSFPRLRPQIAPMQQFLLSLMWKALSITVRFRDTVGLKSAPTFK